MPDISMCPGNNCPKKEECYRFTAIPNEPWQAYFIANPDPDGAACEFFWPLSEP